MSQDISYTAEEIAKLLKISKLTVYELIKRGELPSYRVGKQMRVDASDLEAYKHKNRNVSAMAKSAYGSFADTDTGSTYGRDEHAGQSQSARSLVITGQDISLDILARHLENSLSGAKIRTLRSHSSSIDSLISLYKGESDIVSTHLLDGDSGDYNLPYISKLLIGFPYMAVNLMSRTAGLYVAAGNPRQIRDWSDLSRPGIRIVNRERGAGARVLLDEQLRLHGITPGSIDGYDREQTNHLSVATMVGAGEADVGVGTEKTASIIGGIDFIPMIQERYDLVMLKKPDNERWITALLGILRSPGFQQELRAIAGYDLTHTGHVWAGA